MKLQQDQAFHILNFIMAYFAPYFLHYSLTYCHTKLGDCSCLVNFYLHLWFLHLLLYHFLPRQLVWHIWLITRTTLQHRLLWSLCCHSQSILKASILKSSHTSASHCPWNRSIFPWTVRCSSSQAPSSHCSLASFNILRMPGSLIPQDFGRSFYLCLGQ